MVLRKIDAMHERFGIGIGQCGDCPHFRSFLLGKRYFKCAVYGITHSEATDWRKKFTACGLIDKEKPDRYPIIDEIKYFREPEEIQCEGQITMEEILNVGKV